MNHSDPTGYTVRSAGLMEFDQVNDGLFAPTRKIDTPAVPAHCFASDTEIAAANKIGPIAGKLRQQVFAWIIEAGDVGATGKELGARYALSIGRDENDGSARYSVMPRCTELRNLGLIRDSGRRRDGSIVWAAVDQRLNSAGDSRNSPSHRGADRA